MGEQRKQNEELRQNLGDLFANFTSYQAGHIRNLIVSDVNEKRKGEPKTDDTVKDRASASPTWGKTKRDTTPSTSDWESKGDSSTSQSDNDNGWGKPPSRVKDRRRTLPRDDRRTERQRSPLNSRHAYRDT